MPPRFKKFIRKLNQKQRRKVETTITAIVANKLEGLDIKPIRSQPECYRCRIGTLRIIFVKIPSGKNIIQNVTNRGQAYKK